jgi:hypothetical protein
MSKKSFILLVSTNTMGKNFQILFHKYLVKDKYEYLYVRSTCICEQALPLMKLNKSL